MKKLLLITTLLFCWSCTLQASDYEVIKQKAMQELLQNGAMNKHVLSKLIIELLEV